MSLCDNKNNIAHNHKCEILDSKVVIILSFGEEKTVIEKS